MKSFIIFALLLSSSLLQAADFSTGQAARAVIGQYAFSAGNPTPSLQVLGANAGVAWANGTLYVADSNVIGVTPNGNRVMMFMTNQIPGLHDDVSTFPVFDGLCNLCGYPAFNVLGETDYTTINPGVTQSTMQGATAVATDGTVLAVADTGNNRVLIWRSIPTTMGQPADLVLGQSNFTTNSVRPVGPSTLRSPEGVWIQNGKLFVADTQDARVLIWNSIPTTNNQPADMVLGQTNLTSASTPPVTTDYPVITASTLLSPTSVTADNGHLYVTDLGANRVSIWNSIPSSNNQPADVLVGQVKTTSSSPNNEIDDCGISTLDANGNPLPCDATLNFPRFALSDGNGRLFIADGGNDRILIYNSIPTANGAHANIVLGQPDFVSDVVSNQTATITSTTVDNTSSVDTIPSPMSLAWDGTNLYASDPTDGRVLIYTPGDVPLAQKSVLNTASKIVRQTGSITLALVGTITTGDTVSATIGSATYTYTFVSGDTLDTITAALVKAINTSNTGAGDPNAIALLNSIIPDTVFLNSTSTNPGLNTIALSATQSNASDVTATASGSYLTGGNAGLAAPGTLIEVDETDGMGQLADQSELANSNSTLPLDLGGVQVYMDGIQTPIVMVSPNQIITQVPFTFTDRTSSSLYVRTVHNGGAVTVTTANPVTIPAANPGLFAQTSPMLPEPRPATTATHPAGNPSAAVSVDGTIQAGDVGNIVVGGATYSYTVLSTDTLASVVTALINKINGAPDPNVTASAGAAFARVVLTAKQPGAAGTGISVSATVTAASGQTSADLLLTAYQSATCCATSGSGVVNAANPALPNETITFQATGLGVLQDLSGNVIPFGYTGIPYNGTTPNSALNTVSAVIGGTSGQVTNAGLPTGSIGVYSVDVIMPSTLTANNFTQVYIAQNAYISNTVTIPTATGAPAIIATPNPIPISAGQTYGATTISWNVSNTSVQLRVGSPTGSLVSAGGGTGSATTGNWVPNGAVFYLIDATTGATITTLTVNTQITSAASPVIFTANPNPIQLAENATYGQTTIGWYSPQSAAGAEVHLGSATGPLFSNSLSNYGSATTGPWVGNNTTFVLVDTATHYVLSTLVVLTQPYSSTVTTGTGGVDPATASLQLTPNPIAVGSSGYGHSTLSWSAPGAYAGIQVHVGDPAGPLFAEGGSAGTAETGEWISDGMAFYLVDAASGRAVATAIAAVARQEAAIFASALDSNGAYGQTTLTWSCPFCWSTEVHVGSPNGPLFASIGDTDYGAPGSGGSQATGFWVTPGMTFYLQDATTGNATAPASTVSTVTIP